MKIEVTIHEAAARLSELVARALQGDDVVIRRSKEEAVRLVPAPLPSQAKRRFGFLKGKIASDERFDEPLPDEELRRWEGDHARDG